MACVGPHINNTLEIGKFEILKIKKKGKDAYTIKPNHNNLW
jgi:Ser-tRNA(Ala) deacylase AlaX